MAVIVIKNARVMQTMPRSRSRKGIDIVIRTMSSRPWEAVPPAASRPTRSSTEPDGPSFPATYAGIITTIRGCRGGCSSAPGRRTTSSKS